MFKIQILYHLIKHLVLSYNYYVCLEEKAVNTHAHYTYAFVIRKRRKCDVAKSTHARETAKYKACRV